MFKKFFTEYCSLARNNWAPATFSITKKYTKTKKKQKKIQKTKKEHFNNQQSLSTINFLNDHILKKIRNLPPNVAHRHDSKIFDDSIWKLLKLIFQSYLKSTKFSSEWKKRTWFQFFKKLLRVTANQYS